MHTIIFLFSYFLHPANKYQRQFNYTLTERSGSKDKQTGYLFKSREIMRKLPVSLCHNPLFPCQKLLEKYMDYVKKR